MDETDSLFEGMVLFTPNSSYLDQPQPQPQPHEQQQQQQQEVDHSVQPNLSGDGADHDSDTPSSLETASSQPLDESLFSDLTIVSPLPTLAEEIPSFSRQVSRKKKRASLRIGYGRDSAAEEVPVQFPAPDQSGSDDSQAELPVVAGADSDGLPSTTANGDYDFRDGKDRDEVRLEQIKARISEKLELARRSAAAVSESRKEAIARSRRVAERLRGAAEAYAELERRLNEACESEDFETAERLSDSMAAADGERRSLMAALRAAEAECDAVESRMEEVLAAQIAAEEECAALLDQFAQDASNKADLVARTAQEVSSKRMDEWLLSTEALGAKKMELEIESHIISKARTVLDTTIEDSVEDDKQERESLCNKRDVLIDELQKLLLLVKQKEQEIAETECNIEAVDKRITDVVSGFQEIQSNLDSKIGDLQSGLSNIEFESEALSTKKKEIDELLTQEEEKGAKLRELANASAEEAKTYEEVVRLRKNLMVSVLKSREDKVRLAKTEEKLSDDVQMLQQVISSSRASLQDLSTRKSSIQQDIASSKQKIMFIDKRVPELEAEKKVAAAARNFKEAARIAAEAKSLTVEKDSLQVSMERAASELEKLEEEIKDTIEKLQETEVLISSKEKEVAMARFERLLLTAGSATAERAAALELGDLEEANLLLVEAEAADSEAKELQPLYDFKVEEFTNIPKHFISMELVANLGKKQLEELAASVDFSPS